MTGKKQIRLYVHVPFCTKKCPYCHFYSRPPTESSKTVYLQAIYQEIESYKELLSSHTPISLYFGGGTPSLLSITELKTVLNALIPTQTNAIEITIEITPQMASKDLFAALFDLGINRVSLGAQSFTQSILNTLCRSHTVEDIYKSIENATKSGFTNISIDLMYDLPKQTMIDWETSINIASTLPITHVSIYNLVIEPETPWFTDKDQINPFLPSEELSTAMYQYAIEQMQKAKFFQYEISAFAKKGFHSIHNTGYWLGEPFIGFGPSAWSYCHDARWANPSSLTEYATHIEKKERPHKQILSPEDRYIEHLLIGLRMNQGIDLLSLEKKIAPCPSQTKETINWLISKNLLHKNNHHICLTPKGRLLYDIIAVELL